MNDHKYWIALDQAKGICPADLHAIYAVLKPLSLSVSDLFELKANEIKSEFSFSDSIISSIEYANKILPRIEDDYYSLLDLNIDAVLFFEDAYPKRLHDVLKSSIPPVLYTLGNKSILKEKGAAVLTENELSERGENISLLAAREFSSRKIVIISGLERGSGIVHRSALLNGGKTIAIMPHGIFSFKIPDMIKDVFNSDSIIFVSPFYPAAEYHRSNSIIANSLICALSYSAYIVESSSEGDIFNAAKSAKKSGVPLFVTEYKEYPPSASANKSLIDEGAFPVKGRYINGELIPNLDEMIAIVKSGQ